MRADAAGRSEGGSGAAPAALALLVSVVSWLVPPHCVAEARPKRAPPPAWAAADDPPARCSRLKPGSRSLGDVIRLVPEAGVEPAELAWALAAWQSCPAYGVGFPRFELGAGEGRVVRLVRSADQRDGACAAFQGDRITLRRSATLPTWGKVRCSSVARNLAHELGHVLGLADAPESAGCETAIMARMPFRAADRRLLSAEECALADARWVTSREMGGDRLTVAAAAEAPPPGLRY